MKKALLVLVFFVIAASSFAQVVTPVWEKSVAQNTKPYWFDTGHLTRGFDYGVVGGEERLFVVSRNGGSFIYVLDAATGDSLGKLTNGSALTGGTYVVSDVAVSEDGQIFVCNLSVGGTLKVYRFASLTDTAVVVATYAGTQRLGDKLTVTGKASDNSLTIWAASVNSADVVKFTTADNGATFTSSVMTLPAGLLGGSASISPYANGFYYNATSINPKKLNSLGELEGTVPGSVVSTGSNAIRYITSVAGEEYFVTYAYGAGNENGRIVKVRYNIADSAVVYGVTPTLGTNGNSNGAGDVAVKQNADGSFTVFVLSCNNGLGAYKVKIGLAGDYMIYPPDAKGNFNSLGEAVTALNTYGTMAPVRFLIGGNLQEDGIIINREDMTDSTGLTIKPAPGVSPTITITNFPTTGNAKNQGFTLQNASYVTIDGSNTEGGTTQDMTIIGDQATGAYVIGVIENSDNCTIKNLNVNCNNLAVSGSMIGCDGYVVSSVQKVPNNLLITNCNVGTPTSATNDGIALWGNAAERPIQAVVTDCNIYATRRGITTYFITQNKYFNNNIYILQPRLTQTFYAGIYLTGLAANDTCVVANNKITKINVNHATAGIAGAIVIYGNTGVLNIYNNFLAPNTENVLTGTAYKEYGIVFNSSGWNGVANIYHNTINIESSTSTNTVAGIGTNTNSSAIVNVYNNIIVNKHNAANAYGIYWTNTPSVTNQLISNNNDIYLSGALAQFGRYTATSYATLNDWTVGTTLDSNSVSKEVLLVSNDDLHLTGASVGDIDLAAPKVDWINTDIDNEPRTYAFVYMGADEGSITIPVELTSFAATVTEAGVQLDWSTATETNNKGFEVERSTDNSVFSSIAFVQGNGTSTERHSYSYVDNSTTNSKVYYRLKQIDFDGSYSYSNTIEADFAIPASFELSQNYPNPFNPTTTINFSLPMAAKVVVKVFDILGREVVTLANQDFEAGKFNLQFNAANLSSGTYFYTINAEGINGNKFHQVKKMMLIK